MKHFFTKTEQTFQYIKNIIGGDYTFNDHLRAINSDYGNNYWFNDYKTCVEQIVKTQYQECIDIKNAVDMFNSTLKNKKNEKDKTIKKINDFVEKNYDTTKNIIKEYESNRLYDFDNIDNLDTTINEMINIKGPVIADIRVEKEENCFPMIPSGAAHNEMILSSDDNQKDTSNEGLALV